MQISHVWGTSYEQIPYYYEQQTTIVTSSSLQIDITEKFIFLLKIRSMLVPTGF